MTHPLRRFGRTLALCGVAASLVATLGLAGPAATLAATSAASTTTAACIDGHWPATVQGVPTLWHAGARAGDYIWHDRAGWHLRVTHPGAGRVVFTGRVVSSAPLDGVPVKLESRDSVSVSADHRTITYRLVNDGRVDGFDFRTACATRLTFAGAMGGVRLSPSRIVLGHADRHPLENPFVIRRVA